MYTLIAVNLSLGWIFTFHVVRHGKRMPSQCANYSRNAPLNRTMRLVNKNNIDLFVKYSIEAFVIYLNNLIYVIIVIYLFW